MARITKSKKSKKVEEEKDAGDRISQQFPCIADELLEEYDHLKGCGSSDALSVYQHIDEDGEVYYDAYCWSCNQVYDHEMITKTSIAGDLGLESNGKVSSNVKLTKASKAEPLTKEQAQTLMKQIGYKAKGYRGIKDEFVKYYGCLTKLDQNGEVEARYYPETTDGKVAGYTIRKHPKNFRQPRLGKTGMSSDLYGQVRWRKGSGKYVLVVGGQEDCHAALQMFVEYNRSRGQDDYDPFPIVSPTTGEGSAYKQLAAQYDWLDSYDGIYLALDSDKAGREAVERCIEVLPAEKVHIVTWSGKDPNDMLQKGKQKQFIRDFYNAKPYFNDGIKTSAGLYDAVIEELNKERLTLPPYMSKMQKMMGGGVLPATITNIIADTSVGKSSHVNNCIYHWVMTASETVTIISLEATEGQLGEDLFSLHLGVNLRWMSDEDKDAFFEKEETKEKLFDLMFLPDGQPRFLIIDERDADIEKCEKRMEKAFKQYGSRIFVFDVLTDALRGVASELQESHMVWQKMFIKNDIRIINVLHTRKPPKGKDGKSVPISEYDALGSSTFVQSGAYNILLERDKESDDLRAKNTTRVRMPKCRKGITGKAGDWYFDFDTRQCYDYEEHFGEPFEEGDTKTSSPNTSKKKFTKPNSKKVEEVEEDKPPFDPDTSEGDDDNPFTGED